MRNERPITARPIMAPITARPITARPTREAGFTLLEMVVVVTMFGMLAGLGVPITELYLRNKMLEATQLEMLTIRDGVLSYYDDLEEFPAALVDLVASEEAPEGWLGPYLAADFNDSESDQDNYEYDVWRSAYVFEDVSSTVRRLKSLGPNHTDDDGDGDDIVLDIDAGPALGDLTRREVEIINTAILTYSADFMYSNPLSTDYETLLEQLQDAGYMPADSESTDRYLTDAWGQTYVTNGQVPVIEVRSPGAP